MGTIHHSTAGSTAAGTAKNAIIGGYIAGITDPSNFNPLTANITYIPRNYRTSYVQTWHLSLQQELGRNTLLDIGLKESGDAQLSRV